MLYRVLADVVVAVHLAFVVFVIFGGFLTWRWPKVGWAHVPSFVWGGGIAILGWICPLTYLENHLRSQAGEAGYPGGFVEHYVIPVLYPGALTRDLQYLLAAIVVIVNVAVYGWVVYRWRRSRTE